MLSWEDTGRIRGSAPHRPVAATSLASHRIAQPALGWRLARSPVVQMAAGGVIRPRLSIGRSHGYPEPVVRDRQHLADMRLSQAVGRSLTRRPQAADGCAQHSPQRRPSDERRRPVRSLASCATMAHGTTSHDVSTKARSEGLDIGCSRVFGWPRCSLA